MGEVEDVADGRRTERVDRLRVVADHGHTRAVRLQAEQDPGLERVRVLVLVDQHVVEALLNRPGQLRLHHQVVPVEQEVVVVEHVVRLLVSDVGAKQRPQLVGPLATPRERAAEHLLQGIAGAHRVGVDSQAGGFSGKAPRGARQAELVAQEVDAVRGVRAIENGEARIETDRVRMETQQAIRDAVERARPGQVSGSARFPGWVADPARAAGHLGRRTPREREQQDPPRVRPVPDQVGDPMRERVGLSRSRARDDQERRRRGVLYRGADPVANGGRLSWIELLEDRARIHLPPPIRARSPGPALVGRSEGESKGPLGTPRLARGNQWGSHAMARTSPNSRSSLCQVRPPSSLT